MDELRQIVNYEINDCHIALLVDTMLSSGSIQSISRYSMKKDRTSLLTRSSFEESIDHFAKGVCSVNEKPLTASPETSC